MRCCDGICSHEGWIDTRGDVYIAEWISIGRITKLTHKSDVPALVQPQAVRMG